MATMTRFDPPIGAPPKRVLVVDDDASSAKGLRVLLELDGYDVVAVERSAAALDKLRSEKFDAVITDLEMPRVHGIEVVRAARALSDRPSVLVMTGYSESPAAEAAIRAGARRVFAKPVEYDALASELADSLDDRAGTRIAPTTRER
jgi:DNA-binding NtrC family response regulator